LLGGVSAALVAVFSLGAETGRAQPAPAAQLFDTSRSAAAPLASEAFARRSGWTMIPEEQTSHACKGDAVLMNDKIALVLRRRGHGAEVYARAATGAVLRAELVPTGQHPATKLNGMTLTANTGNGIVVEATYASGSGESLVLEYGLTLGQPFVQTRSRRGVARLQVVAPCRFAVLPDFFADDFVVDAAELPVAETEVPSESFFMHLLGQGEALLMVVGNPAREDVRIALTGTADRRVIRSSEFGYAPDGKVDVAVLERPGIWHRRDVAADDADRVLPLDWRAPYPAHWRVDWRRDDTLTDSWEMLMQGAEGEYVKHGWYGQPESFGNDDWAKEGRRRWTTVLGFFQYPCWMEKDGTGYLQPLKKGARFQGPALIYPINRLETTPLEAFTVVDVMRATLGVGPCEYILDVEGQKKTFHGRPTCASRTILDTIYSHKEQKAKREEVRTTLDEVLAFVRHIRGRIEDYVTFARRTDAYLDTQRQSHPDLAGDLAKLQTTIRRLPGHVAQRQNGIKTPQFATQLVDDFRANLLDDEGPDALAKCKRITAALVDIGGNQDELVGECRMVVKTLRQQIALASATDPRLAPIARELRQRTRLILRNPASYEAPHH
jgi:hypothetical protein